MLFSSNIFMFGFLPLVLILYYVVAGKRRKLQNIVLLLASLFFYFWGEPWFVLVMLLSIVMNWLFALSIHHVKAVSGKLIKLYLVLMLLFNLGILYIFKYLSFTLKNINYLFDSTINVPNFLLPIGISFFTFQAISYVIDVYRGTGVVQKNPLNVGLYISFFPQLIAGPIVRYSTIHKQIKDRVETLEKFERGVKRFIIGLAKKTIIANTMAIVADQVFDGGISEISIATLWLGVLAYGLQIYFDFSGYSDMAIGLGLLFGFEFLENFNYPYISKSISEFWRRWHISLGTWFRDYVYFPLGGSRVESKWLLARNLLIVWFLTGFWHGANWTFILWGLMYFVLIIMEKLTGFEKRAIPGIIKHFYTLTFVGIGWVLFRSESVLAGVLYLKSLVGMGMNPMFDHGFNVLIRENLIILIIGLIASRPIKNIFKINFIPKSTKLIMLDIGYVLILILDVVYVIKGGYNPFIYFNF